MPATEPNRESILKALREINDPEVGTNIVDLGLVYGISVSPRGVVTVDMTTTTRFCPASGFLAEAAKAKVESLANVSEVAVNLVYDPPWSPEMADPFSLKV
jgi:metal-sulfur cluster biosynthetic enzyme